MGGFAARRDQTLLLPTLRVALNGAGKMEIHSR
jgi:hypothetical protein